MPDASGRYNDGYDSTVHAVRVTLDGRTLTITGEDGHPAAAWPLDGIRLVDPPEPGRAVRLASGTAPDARLTLDDPDFIAAVLAAAPPSAKAEARLTPGWLRIGLLTAATVLIVTGIYLAFPFLVETAARLVPNAVEARMGQSARDQVVAIFASDDDARPLCDDPNGRRVLQVLAAKLAAQVDTSFPLEVEVVRSELVNALALPGGHIVLFEGLIAKAASADEVAGVLAHEMGHVAENHAMQSIVRSEGLALLFQALFGAPSALSSVGEGLVGLSYSRAAEAEADRIALDILTRAGLRTDGAATFFARLAERERNLPEFMYWFSTHPPSAERAARAREAQSGGAPALSRDQWAMLRRICER